MGTLRRLAPLLALALSLASLAACQRATPTPAAPVTLRLLVPQLRDAPIDPTYDRYKALAGQLETTALGYKLEVVRLPTDSTRYAADVAAENAQPDRAPDLVVAHHGDVPGLVASQAILSLDRFAKNDRDLKLDDYFPAVLAANRYRGQLYALPYICSPEVLYYSPKLFAAAGLPPPSEHWTWAEFVQTAKALTRDTNKDGKPDQYGFIQWPGIPPVTAYIWQNGADLVDSGGRVTLDQPAAVEAIRFMGDLALTEGVSPSLAELSGRSPESVLGELVLNDRVAMFMYHVSIGVFWREPGTINFDLAEPPQGRARATPLTSSALAIGAKTRNPEAAYRALRAIVAEAEKTALVPPRRSLARDLRKVEPRLSDQDVRVITNALEYARGPVYERHQAVMAALRDTVELPVLLGRATPQEAARSGATAIEKLLDARDQ